VVRALEPADDGRIRMPAGSLDLEGVPDCASEAVDSIVTVELGA
jgi:hypothetical protein